MGSSPRRRRPAPPPSRGSACGSRAARDLGLETEIVEDRADLTDQVHAVDIGCSRAGRRRARQSWRRPFAASSAWLAAKHSVTLVRTPWRAKWRKARRPSSVSGSIDHHVVGDAGEMHPLGDHAVGVGGGDPRPRPGPSTRPQISATTSLKSRPDLAISDGLVGDAVEQGGGRRRSGREFSATSAVSTKNFMMAISLRARPARVRARVATAPAVRPEFLVEHLGGGGGAESRSARPRRPRTRRSGSKPNGEAASTASARRVAQHGGAVVLGLAVEPFPARHRDDRRGDALLGQPFRRLDGQRDLAASGEQGDRARARGPRGGRLGAEGRAVLTGVAAQGRNGPGATGRRTDGGASGVRSAISQHSSVSIASAGRNTCRPGIARRLARCSIGWWVGPSSPRPIESWVSTWTGAIPISAARRRALRA